MITLRYLIKFSYDGTNFSGYQKQPGKRCVESEFERALFDINNHKKTTITSSGRTDRGVHALCQTAHFDLDIEITLYKLKCALNSLLPDDIRVFSTEIVDKDFHARYMVKEKTYQYLLNTGEYNPVDRNYIYQHCHSLDINKMNEAINYFIGGHNFVNFVSEEAVKNNYERTIFDAYIKVENNIVKFIFVGNGFMKYQVRNMVGTLISVGKNMLDPIVIKEMLAGTIDKKCITTAKREGLYLVDVKY